MSTPRSIAGRTPSIKALMSLVEIDKRRLRLDRRAPGAAAEGEGR